MTQNDTLIERLVAAAEWVNCALITLRTHQDFEAPTDEAEMARSVHDTLEDDYLDIYCVVREILQERVSAGFYVTSTGATHVQDNKAPSEPPE